ncbi:MAG: tRNA (adenosine(37)-N6)-dimethylallyltransferase MiaA [Vampirovibrionia bacterium]
MIQNKPLIIIAGPTASGKTSLAIKLAKILNTEIISADSRIVYKDFNIGTAKPTTEEMDGVKHHLIDFVDPKNQYTASNFKDDAREIISLLHNNNQIPILAGGTGFYIRTAVDELNIPDVKPDDEYRQKLELIAETQGRQELHNMLKNIDPVTSEKLHPNDSFRIIRALEVHHKTGKPISELQTKTSSPYNVLYISLNAQNRDYLYDRINKRVLVMLEDGLIEEVKFLVDKYGKTLSLLKTLGYKEVVEFLESKCSYDEMIDNIQKNTRHFARRQLIWFRADERINWYNIDTTSIEDITEDIIKKIKSYDR